MATLHALPARPAFRVLDHYDVAYGPDLQAQIISLTVASAKWERTADQLLADVRAERERLASLRPGGVK